MNIINASIHHRHVDKFLKAAMGSVYLKDTKGVYLEVNEVFLHCSAMQHTQEALGKTDLDMIWHDEAPVMMRNDQEIITKKICKTYVESAKSLEIAPLVFYLSHKAPICTDTGKVIGIMGLSLNMSQDHSIAAALNEAAMLLPKFSNQALQQQTLLNEQASPKLTARQLDCLFYLIKGMTIKQIAVTLGLAAKTVEHYLNNIKLKLNCHTRSDLISKAIKLPIIRKKLLEITDS